MARYRSYKKKDGTISVTATIRKKGLSKPLVATFDSKTAAATWAKEQEARIELKRYKDPRAAHVPLSKAFDKYFSAVTRRKAANTIRREHDAESQLLSVLGGDTFLLDITPSVLAQYRDQRLDDGRSGSTVLKELILMSNLFKLAIQEWELPLQNPTRKIWKPSPTPGRDRFLGIKEINRLLVECKKSRNPLLFPWTLIMLQTGMRPSEAAALRTENIDVKGRAVVLFVGETKNKDARRIPLTDAAFAQIAKLKIKKKPGEYLFFDGEELPKTYKNVPGYRFRYSYDKAKIRAGLNGVSRHDLRRTAASHMIMRGVDIRTIAAVLGHRTLQQAMTYAHLDDPSKREAVEKIGDLGM